MPATLLIALNKGEKTPGFKSRRPHHPYSPVVREFHDFLAVAKKSHSRLNDI